MATGAKTGSHGDNRAQRSQILELFELADFLA
jgi:hypothetical protein